jgi:hypothetical protein
MAVSSKNHNTDNTTAPAPTHPSPRAPANNSLPPITTTIESMVMVLPPMIQLRLPILTDKHKHLALLWMLLVEFVCLIMPMD